MNALISVITGSNLNSILLCKKGGKGAISVVGDVPHFAQD